MNYRFTSKAIDLIHALGLELPADAAAAKANVARITALIPPAADTSDAAAKILNGEDPTDALAKASGATLYNQAKAQALRAAERQVHQAVHGGADAILKQVRDAVYTPAITTLTGAAKLIQPGTDPSVLVAEKRIKELEAVMNADTAAEKLKTVMKLREALYPHPDGPTAGGLTFRTAAAFAKEKDAFDVVHGYVPESVDEWLKVIQAGSTPWLPTLTEYKDLAAEHNNQPSKREARSNELAEQDREARRNNIPRTA